MPPIDDPRFIEYVLRVWKLMETRKMSLRAAKVVVGSAMYGIGCIEGEVRARIEAEEKL